MKTSTAIGIGLGTAALVGFGAVVLRKPKRRTNRGQQGGGQQGGTSDGGDWPRGETRDFPYKGCLGKMLHLPQTDQLGNNFVWSVHRGGSGDLIASGASKSGHVARTQMWEALRWQICNKAAPSSSGVLP